MILAKCINENQIANSKEDFAVKQLELKKEGKHIYFPGEITKSYNKEKILYCVPLNIIYDCLKFGAHIAIVECDVNPIGTYTSGYPVNCSIASSWQKTIKILNADCKETIDFVFNEVKDPSLVSDGYINKLSAENKKYFMEKQKIIGLE